LTLVELFETLLADLEPLEVRPRLGADRCEEETFPEDDLYDDEERRLFAELCEVLKDDEERDDTCPREVLRGDDLEEEEVL
jgi:hypothetical protein